MKVPRKKRGNPEMAVQMAIIKWLRVVMPKAMINFTKNEINQRGRAAMLEVARAKNHGVMAGWPDLTVLPYANVGVFFIEVKSKTGRVSDTQKQVHAMMEGLGYKVCVARSVDDVRAFLNENGIGFLEVEF